MSALILALLLAAAARADHPVGAADYGGGSFSGAAGAGNGRKVPDRKRARKSASFIPRDEGSRLYEVQEGAQPADAEPPRGELPAPSASPTPGPAMEEPRVRGGEGEDAGKDPAGPMSPEDARDNMRTVLRTRLAATGGVWKMRETKTGKPRSLALQGIGAAKDEGKGRWSGRATFRDKAGLVHARVRVDFSGVRWRVVTLEPEAPPAAPAGSPQAPRAR